MSDPRYPIGRPNVPEAPDQAQVYKWVEEIAAAPGARRAAVTGLSDSQFDTPYREGGWTVRQVAHHVPDSHLNAYVRFRLALTETEPLIKSYDEAAWASLADARSAPIAPSLALLEALHERWVALMRSIGAAEWRRTVRHPELGVVSLDRQAGLYAWHGRHHVAHVMELRRRMGW